MRHFHFITFLTVLLFLTFYSSASAQIYEQTGDIFSGGIQDISGDARGVPLSGTSIVRVEVTEYNAGFASVIDSYTHIASDMGLDYFTGITVGCGRYYEFKLYDSGGSLRGTLKAAGENGVCASGTEEPPPTSGESCSTAICECMAEVKSAVNSNGQVLEQIQSSIDSNGQTLGSINGKIGSILGELSSSGSVNSGSVPTVSSPSSNGRIERNKPAEQPVYEDTGNHFTDKGDAESPGKMPAVPNPSECWDSVGTQCKQPDGTPESELSKDDEKNKDGELTPDKFNPDDELGKDGELIPDEFTPDGEYGKDDELTKDEYSQDGEMTKDPFSKDGELTKDSELPSDSFTRDPVMPITPYTPTEEYENANQFNQTHWYQQTNIYP